MSFSNSAHDISTIHGKSDPFRLSGQVQGVLHRLCNTSQTLLVGVSRYGNRLAECSSPDKQLPLWKCDMRLGGFGTWFLTAGYRQKIITNGIACESRDWTNLAYWMNVRSTGNVWLCNISVMIIKLHPSARDYFIKRQNIHLSVNNICGMIHFFLRILF